MTRLARPLLTLLALLTLASIGGCMPYKGSLYAKRPVDPSIDRAISRWWADEIRRVAQDGDWIFGRSYGPIGDAIVKLTPGEEFSHAATIDLTHGTVVEAMRPRVQEVALEDFVQRYRYIVIVRNTTRTAVERRASVERARSQLGADFDIWGMFGFDAPGKWYCSELVWWASGLDAEHGRPAMIVPSKLLAYGEVVYFSGRRDDDQVQAIAAARRAIDRGDQGDELAAAATSPRGH